MSRSTPRRKKIALLSYELILGPAGNLNLQGNSLRSLRVIGDGSRLYIIGESELREDLIVESGSLVLDSGVLTVKGDLRVQAVTAEGFGGGTGRVVMEDADGHLTVLGDTYFQGGESSLEAGTLELKGDFSILPSTGAQAEIIFSADGTHEVLLSGDEAQTVYFAPPASESSYLFSAFNILRSVNPHPIIAPEAICMRQIPYDLDFQDELILDGLREWGLEVPVGFDVCINADHVQLTKSACPKVYGDLCFDCGVSGGRIDVGKYEDRAAHLTVAGDLVGTELYYNTPLAAQEHNLVVIEGDYIPQGAVLCLCNGWLQVEGDFVCRTEQENGGFLPSAPWPVSLYEGSRVNICGDLLLAASDDLQNIPFTAECTVALYGDLLQSPAGEKSQMIYGIHHLVLAGSNLQTVDASMLYFNDITLANTAREGVVFCHPLYGISGVFNAYGRMDGTMTPYCFPKGAQPAYKDSDYDGIADCLDPDPRSEQSHPGLISAISDGYRDGSVVRFLYNTPSDSAVEEGSVFLALYSSGQMVGLQSIHLTVVASELRELEIDLSEMPHVDCIKIVQFDLAGSPPASSALPDGKTPRKSLYVLMEDQYKNTKSAILQQIIASALPQEQYRCYGH